MGYAKWLFLFLNLGIINAKVEVVFYDHAPV